MFRYFHKYILALIAFSFIWISDVSIIHAQCECNNCPLTLPTSGTVQGELIVSGATNNIMNGGSQYLKAVKIHVNHDAFRECRVSLVAPNGFGIVLSENAGTANNENITFDICFLHCGEPAFPDPGFPVNFTVNSNYLPNQTYTGSYRPFDGSCFQGIYGPVNGLWKLIFQDFTGGNGGTLINWSLEFANNSGTICGPVCGVSSPLCDAEGGELDNLPSVNQYCENGTDLQFSIIPNYNGNTPDPALYSYVYVLNNVITNRV